MPRVEVPEPPDNGEKARRRDRRDGESPRSRLEDDLWRTAGVWGSSHDEDRNLYGLAILSTVIDDLMAREVAELRSGPEPLSWSTIGAALGISRQAAQQRFGVKA